MPPEERKRKAPDQAGESGVLEEAPKQGRMEDPSSPDKKATQTASTWEPEEGFWLTLLNNEYEEPLQFFKLLEPFFTIPSKEQLELHRKLKVGLWDDTWIFCPLPKFSGKQHWNREDIKLIISSLFKGFGNDIIGRELVINIQGRRVHHDWLALQFKYKLYMKEVAVLAGSGVAKAITGRKDAIWNGLLDRIAHNLEHNKRSHVFSLLSHDPHAASQRLVKYFEEEGRKNYLENLLQQYTYYMLRDADFKSPLAQPLIKFDGPVVTFNYDEVLEFTLNRLKADAQQDGGTEGREFSEAVVHLHGVSRGDAFILSQDSYVKHATKTSSFLSHLADKHLILCVGVGAALDDPDLHPWYNYERCERVARTSIRPTNIVLGEKWEHDDESRGRVLTNNGWRVENKINQLASGKSCREAFYMIDVSHEGVPHQLSRLLLGQLDESIYLNDNV